MNLYDILRIKKTASESEIKRAHRRRAMQTHPDKGGSPEEFHEVDIAYRTLIDTDLRAEYDRTGKVNNETVDQLESEARNAVVSHFVASVQGEATEQAQLMSGAWRKNHIEEVRNKLFADKTQAEQGLHLHGKLYKHLLGVKERLTSNGNDILQAVLDNELARVVSLNEQFNRKIKIVTRALEMLKGWEYKADAAGPNIQTRQMYLQQGGGLSPFANIFGFGGGQ